MAGNCLGRPRWGSHCCPARRQHGAAGQRLRHHRTSASRAPVAGAEVAAILERIGGQSGSACVIADVSGTLGTLIGADRMNMKKIAGLGAPVASICGTGTLDGVFLTGVIAALLASS